MGRFCGTYVEQGVVIIEAMEERAEELGMYIFFFQAEDGIRDKGM